MPKHNVSRTMSTQHPDNVHTPFFADNPQLSGDDEIKEAFYTYSHINSKEQLWDCEGKEVDNFVVKKLLSKYEPYFSKHMLGKDKFLTVRVPNPAVDKSEAKILLETLESIPRSFDTAKLFYGRDIAPIFEVSLPMTTSSNQIIKVAQYYEKYVSGKKKFNLLNGTTIADWIGDFKPERVRVIPLMEDKDSILNSDKIVEEFLQKEKVDDYQRVWLARSDPALNYGSLATVLLLKISLQRLRKLQEKLTLDILPILGCGSAPFRGNFKPTNIENCLASYPSVQTFTLQSAFKYDYPIANVSKAVKSLNESKPGNPVAVDEERCSLIIDKLSDEYHKQIMVLGKYINDMAPNIPSRRKRKLHIGLFGYSRKVSGLKLPRAITFCAALYSYGLPPEILGLNALDNRDFDYIRSIYPSFDEDLRDSFKYLNEDNLSIFPEEIVKIVEKAKNITKYEIDLDHKKITSIILEDFKRKDSKILTENISRAGFVRGFLG
jgi:phosphoenolpyruvate carboxylase